MTTMSARDFNRDVSAAKRAADHAPKRSIVDWLQTDSDIEFEPARLTSLPRAADL